MRRRSTLGLAFLLAVSSVIISAGPALAVGDITGTVMAPIQGICVEAYDSGSERDIVGFDITDANGTYTISVPDASYKLFFYDSAACGERVEASTPGVTAKWHTDANNFADATDVVISGDDQMVDIILTGLVSGTVTSGLGGQAIPGICVEAYDSKTELNIIGSDITAADGTYTIGSIAKDYKGANYKLFFYDSDACGERVEASSPEVTARWYHDTNEGADNFVDAESISIGTGDGTANIILTGRGSVKGTLSGGTNLSCMTANLYDTTDFTMPLNTQTGSNTYSFTGLITTPVYTLQFVSNDAGDCAGLASEWHGDIPVSSTDPAAFSDVADTFTVGAGATVTIDATLEKPGTVSGKMISERTDMPIEGAEVRLYPLDAAGNTSTSSISAMTIADGTFTVGTVVAGNYKLEALEFVDGGLTWDGEWWEDAAAQDTATVLVVAAGADTALTGPIDRHGPGALTGTVTDGVSGDPVEGATVTLHLYAQNGGFEAVFEEPLVTKADGSYDFGEVAPGTFDLSFSFIARGYVTEWFDNAADGNRGSIVIAKSTETSSLVTTADAALAGNATISGTVTNDDSGDPVQGATVTLYEDGGIVFVDSKVTAADGKYTFTVVPGEYDLKFTATFYDTEWYNNVASAAGGSVTATADMKEVANAALTGANASISGTVTDDDSGDPVPGVTVRLYRAAGSSVDSTTTAANGTYSFPVVGSGNYDLEFSADGYDTEWYDDAASATAGSVTVGNDEDVVADAALTAEEPEPDPGSISGMITDDSGPVSGVTVEAYVGGAVIGSTTSATDGTYTISGLVDDTYTVLANTGPAENPDSYFSAWYTDAPLFLTDDATDVVVAEGADTGGVDIALQPLFVDVAAGSGFYADIVWMQESGITLGCGNDAYCASDSVTRAQMATFLVRALELAADDNDYFTDDNGNTHEDNINALAGAGVTMGCNTEGTLFCPSDTVTRAQMASFLVRALEELAADDNDYFTDDNGNTHEDNINALAGAGVTMGCNTEGTLFCPSDTVTRAQMAAFIHRALG